MSANGLQTLWPELFIETSILVVSSLAIAFYTIHYPITIEAQGKVTSNDSVELLALTNTSISLMRRARHASP